MWNRQLPTVHRSATRQNQPQEQRDLPKGTLIEGRYRIRSLLARGGMGAVYLANQESLGRDVALKVLAYHPKLIGRGPGDRSLRNSHHQAEKIALAEVKTDSSLDHRSDHYADVRYRMGLEAAAMSTLQHHHIVTVYDQGLIAGLYPYLVMEYVPGRSLAAAIHQQGPMSLPRALHLAWQVACGLVHAHQRSVVHRDIKPSNIMLTVQQGQEWCKILDFGLAQPPVLLAGKPPLASQRGRLFGTPGYMAPEQILGHPIDHRVDVYNLGLLLFEMLAGKPPFPLEEQQACLAAHVGQPLPAMGLYSDQIPGSLLPEVQRLLDRCCAKSPDHRFAHMEDVMAIIAQLWQRMLPHKPYDQAMGPFGYQPVVSEPTQHRAQWTVTADARARAQVHMASIHDAQGDGIGQPIPALPPKSWPMVFRQFLSQKGLYALPLFALGLLFWVGMAQSSLPPGYCLLSLQSTPSGSRVYAQEQLICEQTPCAVHWYNSPRQAKETIVLRFEQPGFWPAMLPLLVHGQHQTAWAPLQKITHQDSSS